MPFQSSDALDDQMLLDGSNGFSTGVVSGTRPDAIPATSLESAINMDYDDFGNLVTRLGSVSIVGNSITSHWEDVITNWESTTSNFASNLPVNCQVYSGFYFDTSASERLIIALNDINANTNQLYYGSPRCFVQRHLRLHVQPAGQLRLLRPAQREAVLLGRLQLAEVCKQRECECVRCSRKDQPHRCH